MPAIIQGERKYKSNYRPQKTFDYEYPEGLKLVPGSTSVSTLHNKIRDEVMQRAYDSARVMAGRHSAWNDIDHTLTAYIPVDEKENIVKDADVRKPISIVFPYTYTILETLLSYFVAAFLQEPYFRYEGVSGNDVIGAILLELIISLQCNKNKVGLSLHTQARDAFAYGFGASTPVWTQEFGKRTVRQKVGLFRREETITLDNQLLFEGNALENIDPYLYLPDVSVPIHDPQRGDYNGWMSSTTYMQLLGGERNSDILFNVKYLNGLKGRVSSVFPSDNSGRNTKSGVHVRNEFQSGKDNTINIVKMYIRLIPEEWGIGKSEYPELWYFEVAQDEIVIQARPANLDHNKFPVSVICPDYDGYSTSPISRIEMLYGMQGILDFMFNSHVANVRKAINDMIIYDPYLVNSNDLKNPEPGKLIRLRRPAWGKGVKDVAQQLAVTDVTRGNMADTTFLVQWMDRVSAADASAQGNLRQGGPERLTSTEFQGTRAGTISRLERIAKIVGMQGVQDIAMFFGVHNRQMMSAPGYIKLQGDWQDVLMQEYGKKGIDRGRLKVDPNDLDIYFNVLCRDGSVPGGNYSETWVRLFGILGQNQELARNFDVVRIFTHIARNLGAKNVNDFVRRGGGINPQVMPTEAVAREAQAGNLVPIGEAA